MCPYRRSMDQIHRLPEVIERNLPPTSSIALTLASPNYSRVIAPHIQDLTKSSTKKKFHCSTCQYEIDYSHRVLARNFFFII